MKAGDLVMWHPGHGRFSRVAHLIALEPANAPHCPHVKDAARVRLWRSETRSWTVGHVVIPASELSSVIADDERYDERVRPARRALEVRP